MAVCQPRRCAPPRQRCPKHRRVGLAPADNELTARESEVVGLTRHGLTNREIAARLGVSIKTVHLGSAYERTACAVAGRRCSDAPRPCALVRTRSSLCSRARLLRLAAKGRRSTPTHEH